jgi:hypothetical protein
MILMSAMERYQALRVNPPGAQTAYSPPLPFLHRSMSVLPSKVCLSSLRIFHKPKAGIIY